MHCYVTMCRGDVYYVLITNCTLEGVEKPGVRVDVLLQDETNTEDGGHERVVDTHQQHEWHVEAVGLAGRIQSYELAVLLERVDHTARSEEQPTAGLRLMVPVHVEEVLHLPARPTSVHKESEQRQHLASGLAHTRPNTSAADDVAERVRAAQCVGVVDIEDLP